MATDIERVVVAIEANTKSLERQLKKVERNVDGTFRKSARSTRQFNTALNNTQKQLATFGKVFAGAFAVTAVAQVPGFIRSIVSEAAKLGQVADKVGLTTGALQELRFAAELSGVAASQLDVGMQRFARRLAEAANGSGDLYKILKANNIELRDADGSMRDQTELLDDYADLIKNAASEQEQLLLAFKAFDTEGAGLVNMLRDGSAGLRELRREAHEAGGVIRDDLIREMEQIDQQFAQLSRTIGHTLKSAILEVVGAFSSMGDELPTLVDLHSDLIRRQESLRRELGLANVEQDQASINSLESQIDALTKRIQGVRSEINLDRTGGTSGPITRGGRRRSRVDETPKPIIPDEQDITADRAAASAEKAKADAINRTIESLIKQEEALTLSSEAQRLSNALSQAGVSINSEDGQEIAERVERINELIAAQEQAAQAQQKFNDAMSIAESSTMTLFDSLIDGADDFGEALEGVAKSLTRMVLQASLFGSGPMASLFGTGQQNSLFGSLLSGLIGGGQPMNLLSGISARASGGPVSANKPYLVGERGPELIVPKAPGTVVPNHALGGSSVSVMVSVDDSGNIVPVIERVSGRVSAQVVGAAAPRIVDQSVSQFGKSVAGGDQDKIMAGRFGVNAKAAVR